MTANKKRVLLTTMMGDIYRDFKKQSSPTSPNFKPELRHQLRRYFEKTGCLVRIDGEKLDKITPQALPNFEIAGSGESGCETPETTDLDTDETTAAMTMMKTKTKLLVQDDNELSVGSFSSSDDDSKNIKPPPPQASSYAPEKSPAAGKWASIAPQQ